MPLLLEFLKNKQIYIARPTSVAGTNKFLIATVTSAWCHIQPLSRQRAALWQGIIGQPYVIYMDAGTDVQQGDKLRDSDNNYYKVVSGGVNEFSFGSFNHLEVIVEQVGY